MSSILTTDNKELDENISKNFQSTWSHGFVTYKGVTVPKIYLKHAEEIDSFEVRDSDIWLCTFPKSGTAWAREMTWCIVNDLDYEGAKTTLNERAPFFEYAAIYDWDFMLQEGTVSNLESGVTSIQKLDVFPNPRIIMTHLPFNLLPRQIRTGERKPKILYVCRNPKDTCVSFYHHCRRMCGYRGSLVDFTSLFLANRLPWAPFWEHLITFSKKKNDENILFLKYEDMKQNLPKILKEVGEFFNKEMTPKQIDELSIHLSFDRMKTNPAVNYAELTNFFHSLYKVDDITPYMRSGTVGQWKEEIGPELNSAFDKWIEQNSKLYGLNLKNFNEL